MQYRKSGDSEPPLPTKLIRNNSLLQRISASFRIDYFGNVIKEDLEGVLACFTDDAEVTIYDGDNAVRRTYRAPTGDQPSMEAFYEAFFKTNITAVDDYVHTIDVEAERCATNFTLTLTPKADSGSGTGEPRTFHNSNFFRCRNGKIYAMTVYFARIR